LASVGMRKKKNTRTFKWGLVVVVKKGGREVNYAQAILKRYRKTATNQSNTMGGRKKKREPELLPCSPLYPEFQGLAAYRYRKRDVGIENQTEKKGGRYYLVEESWPYAGGAKPPLGFSKVQGDGRLNDQRTTIACCVALMKTRTSATPIQKRRPAQINE